VAERLTVNDYAAMDDATLGVILLEVPCDPIAVRYAYNHRPGAVRTERMGARLVVDLHNNPRPAEEPSPKPYDIEAARLDFDTSELGRREAERHGGRRAGEGKAPIGTSASLRAKVWAIVAIVCLLTSFLAACAVDSLWSVVHPEGYESAVKAAYVPSERDGEGR
jgi:hypothetical protein